MGVHPGRRLVAFELIDPFTDTYATPHPSYSRHEAPSLCPTRRPRQHQPSGPRDPNGSGIADFNLPRPANSSVTVSPEAAHDLSVQDLLHILSEKPSLEWTRIRDSSASYPRLATSGIGGEYASNGRDGI